MRISQVSFRQLMELEPHGPDTYVGIAPEYPWPRLFGGQVLAQGLRAAYDTVRPGLEVHSLHGYFVRPGSHDEPVRYEVDRIRDGRSFATRAVVARQSAGAILNLSCSFQVAEDEADIQVTELPADLPDPEDPDLFDGGWGRMLDRKWIPTGRGRAAYWIRLLSDLRGDEPILQACGLTFISDAAPTRAARTTHPDADGTMADRDRFMGASLDHAIWFHRIDDVGGWHHFDMVSHGLVGGRGLAIGDVMSAEGVHVATVAQEVLLRRRR